MGISSFIRRNIPGSPVSSAKTMLQAYTVYKEQHPNCLNEEALRYTLESRYQIIKSMTQEKMEEVLAEANTLGHLVFLVVAHDNPAAAHPIYMKMTVLDLYDFLKEHVPDQLGGLDSLRQIVLLGR